MQSAHACHVDPRAKKAFPRIEGRSGVKFGQDNVDSTDVSVDLQNSI